MGHFDDEDGGFDPVVENTEFVRVEQLTGHLVIVFPIGYIPHNPTKFTVPGKKSDVIVSDIIDLDDVDDNGAAGKLYRSTWFRGAQLIVSLRPRIGSKVLGRIGRGIARNGMNAPWVIQDMTADQTLVERAKQWGRAHPEFVTTPFQQPEPRDPIGFPPGSTPAPPRFPVEQSPQGPYPQYTGAPYPTPPSTDGYNAPPPGHGPPQQSYPQQQPYPQSSYQSPPASPPVLPPAPVPPTQEELDMLAAMRARRQQETHSGQPINPPF